jgi:hypothetical protein
MMPAAIDLSASSLVLLSAGLGGMATLYLIVVVVLVAVTASLLLAYVYSANRTVGAICYVAALVVVFPGVACIGNSSLPPDYVGGFLELVGAPLTAFEPDEGSVSDRIVTFLMFLPIPSLVALVVAAPFVRGKLVARRGRRHGARAR